MFCGARKGAVYIVVLLYAAVLARFSNATNPGECSLGKVNRLCCMFLACFTSWRQRRVAPCVLRYSLEYERHLYIFLCVLVYICIYLFSKLCPMFVIYNFPIVNAVPFLFETMQWNRKCMYMLLQLLCSNIIHRYTTVYIIHRYTLCAATLHIMLLDFKRFSLNRVLFDERVHNSRRLRPVVSRRVEQQRARGLHFRQEDWWWWYCWCSYRWNRWARIYELQCNIILVCTLRLGKYTKEHTMTLLKHHYVSDNSYYQLEVIMEDLQQFN